MSGESPYFDYRENNDDDSYSSTFKDLFNEIITFQFQFLLNVLAKKCLIK